MPISNDLVQGLPIVTPEPNLALWPKIFSSTQKILNTANLATLTKLLYLGTGLTALENHN